MLTLVGDRIFKKELAGVRDLFGEVAVDRRVTERCAPDSPREHGGIFSVRKMTDAQDDDSFWK